jgi:hypothetical protein
MGCVAPGGKKYEFTSIWFKVMWPYVMRKYALRVQFVFFSQLLHIIRWFIYTIYTRFKKNSSDTISNVLRESNIRNPRMYFTLIINLHKSFTIEKLVERQK